MWLELLDRGLEEIRKYISRNQTRKQQAFEAIEAILNAVNTTKAFLVESPDKHHNPNQALSATWLAAASKVRDLDNDLYYRLIEKSMYWSDPSTWTREMIEASQLKLDTFRDSAMAFLAKTK